MIWDILQQTDPKLGRAVGANAAQVPPRSTQDIPVTPLNTAELTLDSLQP